MNEPSTRSKKISLPRGNQNASFMLRIYSKEDCDLQGKIEHVGSGQFQTFQSVGEMVRLIHEKLEQIEMPQATSKLRTWK